MAHEGRANVRAPTVSTSLLTLAFFTPVAAGCLSHEYVIPKSELIRIASLPADVRGARVHAVQALGERRSDAVEPPEHFAATSLPGRTLLEETEVDDGSSNEGDDAPFYDARLDGEVDLRLNGHVTGRGPTGGHVGPHYGHRTGARTVGPGWHEGGGSRGVPGGHVGHGGGAGGTLGHVGGGGGGGDGGAEALVVLAVLAVAIAALAVIGLAVSEGSRFDGHIAMGPQQPVHLQFATGVGELVVPLGSLSEHEAAVAAEAKVMDDEGPGLRLTEQALDRHGFALKLDFGVLAFEPDTSTQSLSGLAAHIQAGYFFTPNFGVLATAALGGADDGISAVFTRHQLGLELQVLGGRLGPLHVGGYANGDWAVIGKTGADASTATGAGFGGGLLLELDLTGRMALTVRAGADLARFDSGWSPAATLAGGLAIY